MTVKLDRNSGGYAVEGTGIRVRDLVRKIDRSVQEFQDNRTT